jgi:hypothetical protein
MISQNSGGRPHSLWAVTQNENGFGHIRLRGIDPTASADTWPAWAVEADSATGPRTALERSPSSPRTVPHNGRLTGPLLRIKF